jgi:hypothetical protein
MSKDKDIRLLKVTNSRKEEEGQMLEVNCVQPANIEGSSGSYDKGNQSASSRAPLFLPKLEHCNLITIKTMTSL